MKGKVLVASLVFLMTNFSLAFAGWDKPEFRSTHLYHYDSRQDDHQRYDNRMSATFNYLDSEEKSLFKITPFYETRRNLDKGLWQRRELGLEIGKDIVPWMYLGDAIQQSWKKEDYRYYDLYEKHNAAESETRLLFSHKLFSNDYVTLNGFVLDEYTYDFDDGAGIRNEVAIGVSVPIGKFVEAGVNWRHIDRIHYYDSDTFEASASFVF